MVDRRNRRHSSSGSSTESDPAPDPPNPPAVIQERKEQRKYQNVVLDIIARSPTLVERMLQFLYTGDYTVEDNTTEVQISLGDSDKLPEPDTWHSEAALRLSQRDQNDVENLSTEDNAVDQIAMSMSNQLAASLMDQCSVNKRTSVTGEGPLTGSSEQMDAIDESLTDCHPCYFHLRMYGEADYFLIKDLKIRAAENFRDSFENCSEKQILARVIKELYSTNADYRDIRN
ncbi:BTB/POZ fold [Penicillium brevicompactum]